MIKDKAHYQYQPLFCEENIWHLVNQISPDLESPPFVLFFVNQAQSVWMMQQPAFGPSRQGCWDYHVVLCLPDQQLIVDFDTALGFESDLQHYFMESFPNQGLIDGDLQTTVRIVKGQDYLTYFSSDRSHMIDENGQCLASFPNWPTIECVSDPLRLVDLRDSGFQDQRLQDRSIAEFLKDVSE